MSEPESIREICRGLVDKYRRKHACQQEVQAIKDTTEAIVNEMEAIVEELKSLPPVPGASYPHEESPLVLTGIDKMWLESWHIDGWN